MHKVTEADYDDLDWAQNEQLHLANNFVEIEVTVTSDPKKSLGRRKYALHDANLDDVLARVGGLFGKGKDGEPIGEPVSTTSSSAGSTRRSTTRRSSGGARRASSSPNAKTRAFNRAAREWAQSQPKWANEVSDSGRLANNVIEAFKEANPGWEQIGDVESEQEPTGAHAAPEEAPRADVEPAPEPQQEWTGQPQQFTGVG